MTVCKKSRLALCVRAILCGTLPLVLLNSTSLQAGEVTFDTGIIKSRGLSMDLNHYFAEAPRFLPGTHSVQIKVNGKDRGTAAVRFNEEGVLCIDNDFLEFAGIMPVPLKASETCHDIRSDYAQAVVNSLPNQEAVELFLPQEAINSLTADVKNFQHGGTAGLLNYSLFSTRNEYGSSESNRYSQASLEAGFNALDWSLRSRYILTDDQGKRNAESIYTYAEHVFVPQRLTMQVGEINASSQVLSGAPILGVQLMPTTGLQKQGSGVSVSGIARTPQARVEIRQSGQVIFSTLVPAGPFKLDDVPMVRSNVDLDVTVVETDGSSSHFIVPAASVRSQQLSRPQGLTISAGQVRDIESDYDDPMVVNVSDGWRILPWMNFMASGAAAEDYQAVGGRTEFRLTDRWGISTSAAASKSKFGDSNSGLKTELQSDLALGENFGLSASATHYSGGYRELTEAMDDDFEASDNVYSGNISFSTEMAGAFSAGFNYNQSAGDEPDSRYLLLTWGKTFKYASVNVNWQTSVGNNDSDDEQDDDLLYINVSIPLGGSQSLSTYMRKQGDSTSYGVANSGGIGDNTNYYISADRDDESHENSFNGNITTNLHYTQLGLGGGTSGNNNRNYNASLSGGIAMHKDGVTFSPYTIKDTFAIAKVSEPKSGIEISTPQGTVWTDRWGQAVVPGLTEWRNSRLEVDANKLPQSMTLANGTKYVAAGHASVSEVTFKVLNSRRVMLRVKRTDGTPLAKGISIVDGKGHYIVTTVDDGHVFLNDADQLDALYAMDDNNKQLCQIDFTLSDKRDEDAFYEEVNGVCR